MNNKLYSFEIHQREDGSFGCSVTSTERIGMDFNSSEEIAKALKEKQLTTALGYDSYKDMKKSIQGIIEQII